MQKIIYELIDEENIESSETRIKSYEKYGQKC